MVGYYAPARHHAHLRARRTALAGLSGLCAFPTCRDHPTCAVIRTYSAGCAAFASATRQLARGPAITRSFVSVEYSTI